MARMRYSFVSDPPADYDEPLMTLLRFMDLAAILFLLAGIVALIAVLTM